MATLITSRDPKGMQAVRLFEDAYNKMELDGESAQRLNENGGELQAGMTALMEKLSSCNQFADEEVNSGYSYPEDHRVKDIADQVQILKSAFPELKDATYDESIAAKLLPPNAEGWFVIPRWEKLGSMYGEAVDKVLQAIGSSRTFYNYREGQTGPAYLRQHSKTAEAFQKLEDEQKGHDILIVPCQLGLRHRGRSVRRAREIMNAGEVGLGALAVGCVLLSHPKREVRWEQLHMDCAGDEFAPDADGDFSIAPYFYFHDGGVEFDTDYGGNAIENCGSASAFLPQS